MIYHDKWHQTGIQTGERTSFFHKSKGNHVDATRATSSPSKQQASSNRSQKVKSDSHPYTDPASTTTFRNLHTIQLLQNVSNREEPFEKL
jgi:hypothetical protein